MHKDHRLKKVIRNVLAQQKPRKLWEIPRLIKLNRKGCIYHSNTENIGEDRKTGVIS